jgi:hypothetical protein
MDTVDAMRAGDRVKRLQRSDDGKSPTRPQSRAVANTYASSVRRNDSRIQMALDSSKIHRSAAW